VKGEGQREKFRRWALEGRGGKEKHSEILTLCGLWGGEKKKGKPPVRWRWISREKDQIKGHMKAPEAGIQKAGGGERGKEFSSSGQWEKKG